MTQDFSNFIKTPLDTHKKGFYNINSISQLSLCDTESHL